MWGIRSRQRGEAGNGSRVQRLSRDHIPVTTGTPAQCRREAQAFSRAAVAFLAPFPSDSDTHLVLARLQFYEFMAHQCDVAILREAFARRATAAQRRAIVARIEFAFLGETGRELTG
jgi:hypothetical protein